MIVAALDDHLRAEAWAPVLYVEKNTHIVKNYS